MTTHLSYAVRIDPKGVTAAALIHAIAQQSITSNSNVQNEVDAGSPYPQCVTINSQSNEASVSTKDIGNALTLLGSEGVALETNGFEAWQLEIDPETGFHKTTDVHRVLRIPRGKIIPVRLSADHQGDATLELRVIATKDPSTAVSDANLPVTVATAQALPTGLAGDERFTLHTATVNGVSFDCNLRWEVNFGNNAITEGCNSRIYDSDIIHQSVQPDITIGGKHLDKFVDSIGLLGAKGEHANTELYFAKRATDAVGFVAGATAEHIKISAEALAYWETIHDASGNGRVENQLRLTCLHDGTNKPLIPTIGVALPS